jgi:hypothetical protein
LVGPIGDWSSEPSLSRQGKQLFLITNSFSSWIKASVPLSKEGSFFDVLCWLFPSDSFVEGIL